MVDTTVVTVEVMVLVVWTVDVANVVAVVVIAAITQAGGGTTVVEVTTVVVVMVMVLELVDVGAV